MKLFGIDISRALKPHNKRQKSAYSAALANRLTEDWPIQILSADAATRWNIQQLRARSRDLERNGGIQERYLSALESNVIGSNGIGLQMKTRVGDARHTAGVRLDFDKNAIQFFESEWCDFGRRGNFDITGKHSRDDFYRLALRSTARDGDVIVLVYRGANVPNRWRIAYQLIEGDYLDDRFDLEASRTSGDASTRVPAGHTVRMGVELDEFKRKVAFWLFAKHPGDYGTAGVYAYDGRRMRIPALGTEPQAPVHCIHLTRYKRAEETRGVPWITPVMMAIRMLEGYEEAELIVSREQACKGLVWERDQFAPDGSPLDYGVEDTGGQLVENIEPGMTIEAPIGYKAKLLDPTHPNQNFPEFVKSIKRKISAGLKVSYNTLFVDLESVNYSSIRAGLLEEREEWKMNQTWFKDDMVLPSFNEWLSFGLMAGSFGAYGLTDYERLNQTELKFRRWPWVDPSKDIDSAVKAIEAKITTRSRVISDQSSADFEDTIDELQHEKEYIEAAKLDPLLAEPKRSGQLIDSADIANDPNAQDVSQIDEQPAKAAQPRDPATGKFVKNRLQDEAAKNRLQDTGQTINVNVDAKSPIKKFKITRPDGTIAQGEISYE